MKEEKTIPIYLTVSELQEIEELCEHVIDQSHPDDEFQQKLLDLHSKVQGYKKTLMES